MKVKKIITIFCTTALLLSFTACDSNKNNESVPVNEVTVNNYEEIKENVESEETEKELFYSDTIYTVGTDIPAGSYLVTCTGENGGMEIVVFSSETEFNNYDNTHKITGGEFRNAVEINAWSDFYLYSEESAFIRLDDGNVIMLDNGMCEFNKCNTMDMTALYPGVYEVGKDIKSGKINILFVSDYPRVTLFENSTRYLDYHKTDRLTGGEEDKAIETNSISSDYIHSDDMCSVTLEDGMILFIQDGVVECMADKGPIIN